MNKIILKLLTIAAVVFTFIGSVTAFGHPITVFTASGAGIYDSGTLSDYAHKVADTVNLERTSRGLKALKYSETLSEAANVRAKEIQTYFSHTRPDGSRCFTAISECGIKYTYAGENIAYGQRTPEEVMNGWMNSEGHRTNILSENYEYIGIGISERNGVYYWTQFFAASNDLEKDDVQTTYAQTVTIQTTSTTPATTTISNDCESSARLDWLRKTLQKYGINLDDIIKIYR